MKFKKYSKQPVKESLTNIEKLKLAFPELDFDTDITTNSVNEELSNIEKLKIAYPELEFNESVTEKVVNEELSNWEKLTKSYPELLTQDEYLTEGEGSNIKKKLKDEIDKLFDTDSNKVMKFISKFIDEIPDSIADEVFDSVKDSLKKFELTKEQSKDIADSCGISENEDVDTLSKIIDHIDVRDEYEKHAPLLKFILKKVLSIVAVAEPTPVLEIITKIVSVLPASVIAKIMGIISIITNPVMGAAILVGKIRDSKNNSLKSLKTKDVIEEDTLNADDENDFIDDDYSFDDVEEDRAHAALYGGDRTYCSCGKKLIRTEWGGYCPDCDNAANYDDNI